MKHKSTNFIPQFFSRSSFENTNSIIRIRSLSKNNKKGICPLDNVSVNGVRSLVLLRMVRGAMLLPCLLLYLFLLYLKTYRW